MPPTTDQADHRLYQPLDRSSRQIRLIEILPTKPDETIKCKLHTVTLNPDTYYVCISYVWGDPSITEEIIVNGVRKQVTINLATALRHLKKHWLEIESKTDHDVDTSKFRLWADALCINQDDTLERGHQVGLMTDIYSSAEMVLAWLSSDDSDVASAFSVLEHVYLDRVYVNGLPQTDPWKHLYDLRYTLSWLLPEDSGILQNNEAQLRSDEPLAHLRQFWRLGFWSRVWIQQEVFLGKRVYYVSPSYRMSHEKCSSAEWWVECCLIQPRAQEPLLTRQQYERTRELVYFDKRGVTNLFMAKASAARVLEEMPVYTRINLYFSSSLRATNPLDYIYGLLAVTKVPIEPDYTKSIREVYIEFVQWLFSLFEESDMEIRKTIHLLLGRHAVGIQQLHGLPTWAPVFSSSDTRHLNYSARPNFEAHRAPVVTSAGSLWTNAIKMQTVEAVYHEPGSSDLFCKGLSSFIRDFQTVYGKATYVDGHPLSLELDRDVHFDRSGRKYTVKHLFVALMDSGLCRPEDFDPDLLASIDPSKLRETTPEWDLVAERLLKGFLFTTEDGYLGLIGEQVFPGDVVCHIESGSYLSVLRPQDGHYLFVHHCLLIGLPRGSLGVYFSWEGSKPEEIEIR